ncbi:hypothetical protein RB195_009595 [Necator americanus]|uniref:Uncharacterized protein n=1 Tax=Necator americanus TaxID=51031 RepID=A0ABR1CVV5_NECAM
MSVPKGEDLMEDIATTSSEKPTLADVEKWDAHVLLAVAKQKLRNEKGSKHTYVGHSRTHLLVFSLMLMQLMMAVVGGGADSL